MVALLLLSYRCIVTINALWLFLMVPWVGLWCIIVVFPDHTHIFVNFQYHNFVVDAFSMQLFLQFCTDLFQRLHLFVFIL